MAKDRATKNFIFENATDSKFYRVEIDVAAGTANVFDGIVENAALKGTAVFGGSGDIKTDSWWIGNAVWGAGENTQLHVLIDAM